MIDGVVDLARRTGLPRIVIGATIIALVTTTPEAVVSVWPRDDRPISSFVFSFSLRKIDEQRHQGCHYHKKKETYR
jgi:hypothetical protein